MKPSDWAFREIVSVDEWLFAHGRLGRWVSHATWFLRKRFPKHQEAQARRPAFIPQTYIDLYLSHPVLKQIWDDNHEH